MEDMVSRYPALLDMSSATVSEHMKGLILALGLQAACIEDIAALREVRHGGPPLMAPKPCLDCCICAMHRRGIRGTPFTPGTIHPLFHPLLLLYSPLSTFRRLWRAARHGWASKLTPLHPR